MKRIHNYKFLGEAEKRLNGLRNIAEDLDLGNGISVMDYREKLESYTSIRDNFNFLISYLIGERVRLTVLEKELKAYRERSLMAVAARYGRNSTEYAKAGGTMRT